ncbi:MAG: T9SS type A sorting domain-containing protein, partial [candidate division WOR-3 bacterium]|nr:T9SS type A sorting domain-containing protein [candidate division WOR-3 bacterium]
KFDLNTLAWVSPAETLTTFDTVLKPTGGYSLKKFYVKDGGALAVGDGYLYAIKGGGVSLIYRYNPDVPNSWAQFDTIPKQNNDKKSVPKTGASLAYLASNHSLYLMIGNNRQEFWRYGPLGYGLAKLQPNPQVTTSVMNVQSQEVTKLLSVSSSLIKNTALVRYNVIKPGYVSVKLYDATGRIALTVYEGTSACGVFTKTLDTGNLRSGIYFIKLTTEAGTDEVKLVIE